MSVFHTIYVCVYIYIYVCCILIKMISAPVHLLANFSYLSVFWLLYVLYIFTKCSGKYNIYVFNWQVASFSVHATVHYLGLGWI